MLKNGVIGFAICQSYQKHLDSMCFSELFPIGEFGEYHDHETPLTNAKYIKSRLKNKDSRYRKKAEYIFYLHDQKVKNRAECRYHQLAGEHQTQGQECQTPDHQGRQ